MFQWILNSFSFFKPSETDGAVYSDAAEQETTQPAMTVLEIVSVTEIEAPFPEHF
ncbi:MAG: hypothetical protein HY918_04005 [Candidatus Doudnabacteria bacterium]|nr:hypothetical protein [Candidatus Doudnabacteria bacterium]